MTLNVLVPDVAIDAGLNAPVAPDSNPLTLSPTVPRNPVLAVTVAMNDVPAPCNTVREPGEAENEKSG